MTDPVVLSPSFLEFEVSSPSLNRVKPAKKTSSNRKVLIGCLIAVAVLGLFLTQSSRPVTGHKAHNGAFDKVTAFFQSLMFWKAKNPMVSLDVAAYMDCNGDSLKENRLVCDKKTRIRKYDIDKGDLVKVRQQVKAYGLVGNELNFEIDRLNNLGAETKIQLCWLNDDDIDKKVEQADQKFKNCQTLTFKKADLNTDGAGFGSDKHWQAYLVLKEDRTFNTFLTQADLRTRDLSKQPWGKKETGGKAAGVEEKKPAAAAKPAAAKPAAEAKPAA